MNEYRKVFKMVDNEEIEIKFSEIKNGMKIKLYEPDGTLVKYKKIIFSQLCLIVIKVKMKF